MPMQRTFSIELTEAEAATVWRMAELSGLPAGQIVRHLYRTSLFRLAVSLATSEWEERDEATGKVVPMEPARQQQRFREFHLNPAWTVSPRGKKGVPYLP